MFDTNFMYFGGWIFFRFGGMRMAGRGIENIQENPGDHFPFSRFYE